MQTPDKKTWAKPYLLQLTGATDSAGGTAMSDAERSDNFPNYDPSGNAV